MSTTPLSTDFKDDILASANPKRKYQMIYNDDGSVSFTDVTQYDQTGSIFGAKEVNEERAAINNIDERRLVTLDEIDLVTEEGYFVDAKAVAALNRKKILYDTAITADGTYTLTDSVENYSKIYVVISLYDNGRQPFTNIIPEELYGIASKIGIPPFSNASYFLDTNILLSGNTAKITSFQKGSAVSGARILKIIGGN